MGMNTASVQRLYVAYFNRPADPVSLAVYEAMLPSDRVATQAELLVLAETYFSPSAEYTSNFEGKSNSQIVDQLYQNIFGRTADADGLIYWATKLTDGSMTVAELALQLSYSAQGTDATVVGARIEAAVAFTDGLDTAEEITGYSGNAAAAEGRAYLAQISGALPTTDEAITAQKDSAVANVQTSIDAAVNAGNNAAGAEYSLTSAIDNITMTAGNDTVFGTDSTSATLDTFNVSDAVNGLGGTDKFVLTVDSIAGATTYTPSRFTNVETLSVTNVDATPDTVTINTSLMAPTGLEVTASTAGVSFTEVNGGVPITLIGNTGAVDVQLKNTALLGASDAVTINMTGNTGNVTVDSSGAQDIESATINATGVNSGTLVIGDSGGSTITSLDVNGTGSLTITAGNLATLTSLDASDNSGGVSYTTQVTAAPVTLTGGSGNDTLTGNSGADIIAGGAGADTLSQGTAGGDDNIDGGAGNDTITLAGANKDDTITGGDGTDTLVINTALGYNTTTPLNDAENISGFEVLQVGTTLSQVMTPLSGITSLVVDAGAVATLTKVDAITAVTLAAGAGAGADLTLASDGTADTLTVNLGSDLSQTGSTGTTLDAVDYETITVNSAGANGNAVTVTAADLTGLTIAGSKNVTVTVNPDTGATTLAGLTSVDASGATGTVNVQAASADAGVTVTPGSGALTVNLGDGADTVTGTAAADNITTAKGNDTVTGLGGNDTINVGAGDDTVTAGDGDNNITLGTGADTLTAGNGANTVTNTSGNSTVTLGNGGNNVTNTAGNMTITTGNGNNSVTNTAGNSVITTGTGNDTITNTAGNSTIVSGAGNDSITLTAGNSDVNAGAGNDTIALGSGTDTVDGGDGTDSATFSHGAGIYDSTISNVETVTGTMTGSGTIDLDNITGVTTLSITANATVANLTVRDIASGTTLNLSDDLAEDGSAGTGLGAVSLDTVAEASLTVKVLGNEEAAVMAETDLTSLTIADADSVTLTANGGAVTDQAVQHDVGALALDGTDTTALTITTVANGGLDIGALTGAANLDSLAITTAAEGDFVMTTLVEADALTTLTLTANGGNITAGAIGGTTAATLDTLTVSATNGAAIDLDAITSSVATSAVSLSVDGAGSTLTMEGDFGNGDLGITTLSVAATNGATFEGDDAEAFNYASVGTLTLSASGTGSSFTLEGMQLESDVETLTISVDGAASTMDIGGGQFLDDIDTLSISVGSYSTLTADTEPDFTDETGMESFAFNVADNATVTTDSEGTEAADGIIVTSPSWASMEISIGASTTVGEDMLGLVSSGEEGEVDVLDLDLAGGTTDVVVDFEDADFVTITNPLVTQTDDAAGVLGWVAGSVTITGSGEHTVDMGEASGAFTITTGSGGDTITAGDGNDVINTGAGADLINITLAGTKTITGGSGADDFSWSEGAHTAAKTVTDFLQGTDDLSLSAIGTDVEGGAGTEVFISATRAQAAITDNDITVVLLNANTTSLTAGTETVADFEDMTDVAAYLQEGFTAGVNDEALIILNNGTNSYIYHFVDGGDTGFEDDELVLVGIVSGEAALEDGDIT